MSTIDRGVRASDQEHRAQALALRGRLTRVRIQYAELPITAEADAAADLATAAAEFRAAGILLEAHQATRMQCEALLAMPGRDVQTLLAVIDEAAADARADDEPLAEAALRLTALRVRAEQSLDGPDSADLIALINETNTIGELHESDGTNFGSALSTWTLVEVLLRSGAVENVETAQQCAIAFASAGAPHHAAHVWSTLAQFHAVHGDAKRRAEAVDQVAALDKQQLDWPLAAGARLVHQAEKLFRAGQLAAARQLVNEGLESAPHRHLRASLRLLLAAQLSSNSQPGPAADELRLAYEDLKPVMPTRLAAEVLAQLAAAEAEADLVAGTDRAASAIEAALACGDVADAARFLRMRAQLRIQSAMAAGRQPVLDNLASDDLFRAAQLVEQLNRTDARQSLIGVFEAYGQAAFFERNLETAAQAFDAAVDIARDAQLGPDLAFALWHTGLVAIERARPADLEGFQDAESRLCQANELFRRAGMDQIAWQARFMAGDARWEAAKAQPDPDVSAQWSRHAMSALEATANDVEDLRLAVGGTTAMEHLEARMSFAVSKERLYRVGFQAAHHGLNDPLTALRWLERRKSRALLDAVADLAAQGRDTPPGLTLAGDAAIPRWRQIQDVLTEELQQYGRRIVVAEYVVDNGIVWLFGIAAGWEQPQVRRLTVDMNALDRFVQRTYRSSGGVRMMMQDSSDGGHLDWHRFAGLVTPIAEWADRDDVVYLVADGPLHDLPLHTLPTDPARAGLPLALSHSVVYAPSLAVLINILSRPELPQRPAAVFADPRGNLPWAVPEAQAIARALDAPSPSTGAQVTRQAVMSALEAAGTVHIAAHARTALTDGFSAGIQLAGGDTLRARDLLLTNVRADLVILSGCETGVSQHRPGDEAAGLVPALLHSGARALVTSQWRINDHSARRLQSLFHTHDVTLPRVDALRKAMGELASDDATRHFLPLGRLRPGRQLEVAVDEWIDMTMEVDEDALAERWEGEIALDENLRILARDNRLALWRSDPERLELDGIATIDLSARCVAHAHPTCRFRWVRVHLDFSLTDGVQVADISPRDEVANEPVRLITKRSAGISFDIASLPIGPEATVEATREHDVYYPVVTTSGPRLRHTLWDFESVGSTPLHVDRDLRVLLTAPISTTSINVRITLRGSVVVDGLPGMLPLIGRRTRSFVTNNQLG